MFRATTRTLLVRQAVVSSSIKRVNEALALPRLHGQCYAAEAAAWNAIIFCSGVM